MTRPAFEESLRTWLAFVLTPEIPDDRVIYSDGGGPRPKAGSSLYASMRVLTDAQVGALQHNNIYQSGPDTIDARIRSGREGTVGVQVYGDGHHTLATRLQLTLKRQDVLSLLEPLGLTVNSLGAILRLSQDTDNVIEDRSAVDFTFRYAMIDSQITDEYIETVIATGSIT